MTAEACGHRFTVARFQCSGLAACRQPLAEMDGGQGGARRDGRRGMVPLVDSGVLLHEDRFGGLIPPPY